MSNNSGAPLKSAHHPRAENEQAAAQHSNHQLPTPPRSSNMSNDHSDAASMDSQNSRRRYRRGGRKKKNKKGGKLHSVSEFELPKNDQLPEDGTPTGVHPEEETPIPDDYDDTEKARSPQPPTSSNKTRPPNKAPKARETGIRGFNIARADALGGKPMGITIERPKSKDSSKGTERENKAGEGSGGGGEAQGEGEGEGDGQDGDTETDKRKPVAIRLDLNLEVEVFFRAKIVGDVTITFLE